MALLCAQAQASRMRVGRGVLSRSQFQQGAMQMITLLYMIRIIAMVYMLIFALAGSGFLIFGFYLILGNIIGPDATGLGVLLGLPVIFWAGFLLFDSYVCKFSVKGILPMIGIFAAARIIVWSGNGFPIVSVFFRIPPQAGTFSLIATANFQLLPVWATALNATSVFP